VTGPDRPLDPRLVLDEVAPTLDALRRAGKIRFCGITALGATPALHAMVASGAFDTAQIVYNLLNPSAGGTLPPDMAGQDFAGLLAKAHAAGMGTIVIRVLAGGALSGSAARHPIGMTEVEPIASGPHYAADVAAARRLQILVDGGYAESLVEAGLRFAIANPTVSTVLIGTSTLDQLEYAARSVLKGPLPPAALEALGAAWRGG
jgi:aryl-alcohol dehydrogenase-like predicted oxidoreductase